jgi:hypothetical protein
VKLHIERTNGYHRVIETKEFDTNNYHSAIGLAICYCHDIGSEPIDIRKIEDVAG